MDAVTKINRRAWEIDDLLAQAAAGSSGRGAIEWQWTLGQIMPAVITAGMELLSLGEHPEPFWKPGGVSAAAWDGRLPNSFSMLARCTR